MKVGVLTGGGDCSGLNAVIRAIVKYGTKRYNYRFLGIKYGWGGLVPEKMKEEERITLDESELNDLSKRVVKLTPENVSGILIWGGTLLKSSRANPSGDEWLKVLRQRFDELKLDALIAIGGEDTLSVAHEAFIKVQLPVVGVPKTIDNDVYGTDSTVGFTTAYEWITENVDRLHTTAQSHHRILIVEAMGREAGWLALRGGIAGGADVILIKEKPLSIDEIVRLIKERQTKGKKFSIIVVAEGYPLEGKPVTTGKKDPFGHEQYGGVAYRLASVLREKTGFYVGVSDPKHTQRGGVPAAYDRWIGTLLGMHAVDLVARKQFGRMAVIPPRPAEVSDVALDEVRKGNRVVPTQLYDWLSWLFGAV